ncbi:ATP-dependent RNA helicase HrpA [Neptuniibacter sp. CAU 1671]|uniref:ATP-dependent RNA helicase HrpA n=1 Tax=Neptuniibacter sp. CAU 1671 TaxID=3032593 RepID=UPI0023DBF937|nr:ATP-dependent RNA helicase HrpA [Neptuniibacter sp. CAU 1671]MDF2181976.1 ATP-dependent RNA helicase HrpA [Neptuniibacter sp. CAU 1671]
MSSTSLNDLQAAFSKCLIKDRVWLERKFANAQQRSKRGQPVDKLVAEMMARVEQSILQVEARAQSGEINYPDLPVAEKKAEIKAAIAAHQVVVVAGETGSGKTTQLPKMCLELGYGCKGLIGHTQPRRLAARTVANRIAEELGGVLGQRVGYQVRFHESVSESTQVKLMTDGLLLAAIQSDPLLLDYEVIIIDEAHERSLNIDFLLGYLKRLLPQRPDLKLIITSATIDLQRFSKHFNNAPVIEVSGRTYPVELIYQPATETEEADSMPQQILLALETLIETEPAGHGPQDVLIFFSGEREIRESANYLRKAQAFSNALKHTEILPLYARLSLAEQNRVFNTDSRRGRRIVLATNVAETSLTVPGIRYVIDTGTARISRYSYRSKVQRLPIEPISKASANQRSGRCGRIAPGVCVRLYSEEDFNSRPDYTDAEIRRTNLAAVILQMLALKLGDIKDFPFIDPPDNRFINDGYKLLQELGAVDEKRALTHTGRILARLPVDPRLGRMIIESARKDCLSEMLIIVSALSVQDPRERPADKQQASDEKHRTYAHEESDFLSLVNLWQHYEEQRQALSQNQLRSYCQKNFLSFMRMREWRDVHRQLHLMCREIKATDHQFVERAEPAGYAEIHQALLAGLLSHMGFRQEKKEYLGARNRRFQLFPGSGLYKKPPKWIIAAELVETSQLYARCVARIEPEWAEPLASHLIKRNYSEPHWHKKRAQVMATEQVLLYGLVIVPGRRVNYGKIDPVVAHELFIRGALVEGEYNARLSFIAHNRQLLDSVALLEDKSRRRDLLVDEEQLYEFYQERLAALGGREIVNGVGFEKWFRQLPAEQQKQLELTENDVLQRSTGHVSAAAYPDQFSWGKHKLKLSYNFAPGTLDDGVSLEVPLPLLKQLPMEKLEWLVPGMLEEKSTALLKGLPKQLRKHFVPVPDFASGFVQTCVFAEGNLYSTLAHHLLRQTAIRVDEAELRKVTLPDHCLINIKLIDAKGKLLAQSRDLHALQKRFAEEVEKQLNIEPSAEWGREQITRWDFGDIRSSVRISQYAGVEVEAYPALEDKGSSVTLCLKTTAADARAVTLHGLIRLAMLSLPEPLKYLRQKPQLNRLSTVVLQLGADFPAQQLQQQLIGQAIRQLMELDQQLPLQQNAFEESLLLCRGCLIERYEELLVWLQQCAARVHQINKQLKGQVQLNEITVLNDIKQQIAALLHTDFVADTPWAYLQHYPRYLQAIEIRLEKFRRTLRENVLQSEALQQLFKNYENRRKVLQEQHADLQLLEDYRWMLEEYRVSLFAQQLGTQYPVSEKRLRQLWASVSTG